MGKSYNTTPPKIKAEKAYNDLKDKLTFYPRVIERKPYPGDTHPVSKQKIQKILPYIAKEYIYGLTEIELRAREPNRGKPLGYYGIIDQKIVLYSMPKIMRIKAKSSQRLKEYYESYHATVIMDANTINVSWKEAEWKEYWFLKHVFVHELGHHYSEFYKCRKKAPDTRAQQEYLANLYGDKIVRDHWLSMIPRKVFLDMTDSLS